MLNLNQKWRDVPAQTRRLFCCSEYLTSGVNKRTVARQIIATKRGLSFETRWSWLAASDTALRKEANDHVLGWQSQQEVVPKAANGKLSPGSLAGTTLYA